jgi:hypothetical protein
MLDRLPFDVSRIFLPTLACMLLLLVICHVAPERLIRWNSVPWAFQIRRAPDMALHGPLYAAYHGTRFARWSHWFFLLDVPAWFVLLFCAHPALLVLQLVGLSILASRIQDRLTSALLVALWGGFAALTPWIAAHLGVSAGPWAEWVLLVNALLRLAGHTTDLIPPLVGEPIDRFRPFKEARFGARLLLVPWIGYLSELAAGLPWGLIRVHAAWAADRLRHRGRAGAWAAMVSVGDVIRQGGLQAHPTTAELIRRRT